eukprot:TRINITY_DN1006_c0_g1_i15.p1 TRINITY_DN1006_c0_g1~~TRINITY_DN1006_c0_g1_i15.p1  ORF type:complete len:188 (-),score=23.89 TRINITY_DN1006_c0_g1_i15:36-599(-)
MIEGQATGQVLAYHTANGQVELIADHLQYANGLALSTDGNWLLVAETGRYAVHRIDLRLKIGPVKYRRHTLVKNLPGYPDNIHSDGKGGVWASFPANRNPADVYLLSHEIGRAVLSTVPHNLLMAQNVQCVRFNETTGEILEYAEDPAGTVIAQSSGVRPHGGYLYIASVFQNRLARIPLKTACPRC